MNTVDPWPGADLDSFETLHGTTHVSFAAPMPSSAPVPVVSLFIEGSLYRLGGSCCCPNKESVVAWAAAWSRCAAYIEASCLQPGWPDRENGGAL